MRSFEQVNSGMRLMAAPAVDGTLSPSMSAVRCIVLLLSKNNVDGTPVATTLWTQDGVTIKEFIAVPGAAGAVKLMRLVKNAFECGFAQQEGPFYKEIIKHLPALGKGNDTSLLRSDLDQHPGILCGLFYRLLVMLLAVDIKLYNNVPGACEVFKSGVSNSTCAVFTCGHVCVVCARVRVGANSGCRCGWGWVGGHRQSPQFQ